MNDKSPNRRKGFVIVEVIVAMVLLAVAVTSLAALLTSISRSGMVATGNAYRNGVLMNEVNRLEGLPFDSVRVGSSSVVVSALPYPHTRAIQVDSTATNIKVISVIITPSNGDTSRTHSASSEPRRKPARPFALRAHHETPWSSPRPPRLHTRRAIGRHGAVWDRGRAFHEAAHDTGPILRQARDGERSA